MCPESVAHGQAGSTLLQEVEVRPLAWEERDYWEELMKRHHYLGFHALMGESLRYVALWKDRWLALLAWSSAALKCGARDAWIGWPAAIKEQRLHLIANNTRFLILPNIQVRNLASRVLALNVKRLSEDWQRRYAHPIWLVETFVDPARFRGSCYRGAGWIELGQTRGFGKRGRGYVRHGEPKTIWVRPLQKGAVAALRDPRPHPELRRKGRDMTLSMKDSDGLMVILRSVPEVRKARGIRHGRISILAVAICAVLSGARSYIAIGEWAGRCSQNMLQRLRCRKDSRTGLYKAPSESAIRRLLQRIEVEAVDQALGQWLSSLTPSGEGAVAFDGKKLRGAKNEAGQQVHLLSAFVHEQGITLRQEPVAAESNEIPAAQPLLKSLDLAGKVVTADAMHTQDDLARFLVEEKKADYLFTVKDNQPTLKQDIADLGLTEAFPPSTPNPG